MNKQLKLLTVLALFLVSLIPASTMATTNNIDNIDINKVEINGVNYGINGTVSPVYAGENVHVKVFWNSSDVNFTQFDVKINVEFDDEEQNTEFFTVRPNWSDSESFVFELPENIDPKEYTLFIELEDDDNNKEYLSDIKLDVVNQKHLLEIYDVNFPYGLEVSAGQTFMTSVGVKNIGHENEEDVKVTLTIPELGLYQRSQKFDLFTEDHVDSSNDDDDEYKVYKDLFVNIPSNTVSGVYEVEVKVDYDDETVTQTYSLVIGAGAVPEDTEINVDYEQQSFSQGTGAVYTITFPASEDYTVNVEGVSSWGTSMIDMDNGKAYIFVSANENAPEGLHNFKVNVLAGSTVVKEFDLTSEITSYVGIKNSNTMYTKTSDIKEGLQIGFAVLLVILIILGIILAAKKIGKSEDYDESLMDEGETYY